MLTLQESCADEQDMDGENGHYPILGRVEGRGKEARSEQGDQKDEHGGRQARGRRNEHEDEVDHTTR